MQARGADGTFRATKAAALLLLAAVLGPTSVARAAPPRLPCTTANETLCGDGGPAVKARLLRPSGVANRVGGGFFVADTGNHAVRRVLPNGVIGTLAGIGAAGYGGDGGPAVAAMLNAPADVSAAPGGAFLIADAGNGVIRLVTAKGVISTVAGAAPGAAAAPASTFPLPARAVRLSNPQGVAAVPGGGFLVADTGDNTVLRVFPDGLAVVVAGTGTPGNAGDGGPAAAAMLNQPTRVLPTPDGGFLILDLGNGVVRQVAPTGTISTVPGSQTFTSVPPGVAVNPGGLARDAQGNLFVVVDHQILLVSPGGIATAIAGTGACGAGGDGGPPLAATLAQPAGLALTPAGALLVADIDNGRRSAAGNVRRLTAASIATVAGASNDASSCAGAGAGPLGALWPIFYITAPRSARAGRAITISFSTTRAVLVRTSLLRKGRRVRTKQRQARPGGNAVTLGGVKKGTYTMRITAQGNVPGNDADVGGTVHLAKRYDAALKVTR